MSKRGAEAPDDRMHRFLSRLAELGGRCSLESGPGTWVDEFVDDLLDGRPRTANVPVDTMDRAERLGLAICFSNEAADIADVTLTHAGLDWLQKYGRTDPQSRDAIADLRAELRASASVILLNTAALAAVLEGGGTE